MQSYFFPYSYIMNCFCNTIKQPIIKHAYTGDWQIIENSPKTSVNPNYVAISELYY